eukprot:878559-Ditylum_brightwellii.AAC.1
MAPGHIMALRVGLLAPVLNTTVASDALYPTQQQKLRLTLLSLFLMSYQCLLSLIKKPFSKPLLILFILKKLSKNNIPTDLKGDPVVQAFAQIASTLGHNTQPIKKTETSSPPKLNPPLLLAKQTPAVPPPKEVPVSKVTPILASPLRVVTPAPPLRMKAPAPAPRV